MSEGLETWEITRKYRVRAMNKNHAEQRIDQSIQDGNGETYLDSTRGVKLTGGSTSKKPRKKQHPWLKELASQLFPKKQKRK